MGHQQVTEAERELDRHFLMLGDTCIKPGLRERQLLKKEVVKRIWYFEGDKEIFIFSVYSSFNAK